MICLDDEETRSSAASAGRHGHKRQVAEALHRIQTAAENAVGVRRITTKKQNILELLTLFITKKNHWIEQSSHSPKLLLNMFSL
jgi:hypothetical protein